MLPHPRCNGCHTLIVIEALRPTGAVLETVTLTGWTPDIPAIAGQLRGKVRAERGWTPTIAVWRVTGHPDNGKAGDFGIVRDNITRLYPGL